MSSGIGMSAKGKVGGGGGGGGGPSDAELANLQLQANAMRKARLAKEAAARGGSDSGGGGTAAAAATEPTPIPEPVERGGKPVCFTCPLCDLAKPKAEAQGCVVECLVKALPENPVEAACSLIFTTCQDQATRELCTSTLRKYADNVLKGDPKFLRIKLGNKAFQARVASVLGGQNFLEGLGFGLSEEDGESYLRLPAELVATFETASSAAFAVLASSSSVDPILDRDISVLIPQPG